MAFAWSVHIASRKAIAEIANDNYKQLVRDTAQATLGASFKKGAALAWKLTRDFARLGGNSKWKSLKHFRCYIAHNPSR